MFRRESLVAEDNLRRSKRSSLDEARKWLNALLLACAVFALYGCIYRSFPFFTDENEPSGIPGVTKGALNRAREAIPFRGTEKLPAPVLELTPEVKAEINDLKRHPSSLQAALDRRRTHYPMLLQIFQDEGIPVELINLAMVESSFDCQARSPMGAVGMWQFMSSTARLYGLRVDGREDQRKDPVLSSIAAARHLRDLFGQYRDWNLVLAAYNAGPGAIDRLLTRTGAEDFWELKRSGTLNEQTSKFVPRVVAAAILAKAADQGQMIG